MHTRIYKNLFNFEPGFDSECIQEASGCGFWDRWCFLERLAHLAFGAICKICGQMTFFFASIVKC